MIIARNLTKNYNPDFSALLNIGFATEERPLVIVGEDGAGKTTLLNILAGLESYEGSVLINGEERKNIKNEDLKISYITHKPILFENKSVYENLKYVYKVNKTDINKMQMDCEIKDVAKMLNIIGLLSLKVKKLNLFEKKLICVARAILKKSKILLIDEPFDGLIKNEISSLWQTITRGVDKLSAELIMADNGQNIGYFNNCEILKLSFGTKI